MKQKNIKKYFKIILLDLDYSSYKCKYFVGDIMNAFPLENSIFIILEKSNEIISIRLELFL